jgi:UDP-N-acetylmuramoylalanine--D-glutamate ligase
VTGDSNTAGARLDLTDRVVGIWGFGREGISMARTASAAGAARVDAVDDVGRRPFETPDGIDRLTVYRGPEHLDRLRDCDVVFVSPGVPWHHPVFAELRESGTEISSAADWFVSRFGAQTIGVTGTKGKSTTASFLGRLLGELGIENVVAGNIGTPLSDLSPRPGQVVVAELSSQQAALLTASPAVAVITNLYEDHLDWHGDTASYYAAKANVFGRGARALVCTPEVVERLRGIGVTDVPATLHLVDPSAVPPIPGGSVMSLPHNAVNAALAVAAAREVTGREIDAEIVHAAAAAFEGLPHRLQTVRTTNSGAKPIRWVDDTLATTGESVVAALRSTPADATVALIVGGMDRQLDYAQVDDYLCSGARRVTLIQSPSNGAMIGRRFARTHPADTRVVADLGEAVRIAAALPEVDVVLLSPGAASYDLYANYEAKGAAFRGFIDALTSPTGSASADVAPPN